MGETTVAIAQARPDINFLGVEVFTAGVGALLKSIDEHRLNNVRIVNHDAVEVLRDMIAPDHWPVSMSSFPIPGQRSVITSDGCCSRRSRACLRPASRRTVTYIAPLIGRTTRSKCFKCSLQNRNSSICTRTIRRLRKIRYVRVRSPSFTHGGTGSACDVRPSFRSQTVTRLAHRRRTRRDRLPTRAIHRSSRP